MHVCMKTLCIRPRRVPYTLRRPCLETSPMCSNACMRLCVHHETLTSTWGVLQGYRPGHPDTKQKTRACGLRSSLRCRSVRRCPRPAPLPSCGALCLPAWAIASPLRCSTGEARRGMAQERCCGTSFPLSPGDAEPGSNCPPCEGSQIEQIVQHRHRGGQWATLPEQLP